MLFHTVTAVWKFVPSALNWMLKSRVLPRKSSPPAPACSNTKRPTVRLLPRSTCKYGCRSDEHHLSAGPPSALPLNALSGVWLASHGTLPVAARFNARFCDGGEFFLSPFVRPKTDTKFDIEATYTFPLDTVGGQTLAKY